MASLGLTLKLNYVKYFYLIKKRIQLIAYI